jgi:hypothetical protein
VGGATARAEKKVLLREECPARAGEKFLKLGKAFTLAGVGGEAPEFSLKKQHYLQ